MSSTPQSSGAARLLQKQYREMRKDTNLPGISVGLVDDNNIFEWEVMLMLNDECKYYGGMLHCTLEPTCFMIWLT